MFTVIEKIIAKVFPVMAIFAVAGFGIVGYFKLAQAHIALKERVERLEVAAGIEQPADSDEALRDD
jgi:hypothetical protein